MSLPKTINYCENHNQAHSTCLIEMYSKTSIKVPTPCHLVELRVAGPDDLVIRREDDGSWPDWVLVGLGWELDDSHDLSAVMNGVWRERPRAAAKGNEGSE